MKTSEVRKAAFKVALELYENASGEIASWCDFDVFECASTLGIAPADIESVWNYLVSVEVMTPRGIGERRLNFTPAGIASIEASLDAPDQSHGPFPPMNVIVGNVHANAQVAIGTGSFQQSQASGPSGAELAEIVRLLREAKTDWPASAQQESAGAEALLAAESKSSSPDNALIRPALTKLAQLAQTVAGGVATQGLLAYLKSQGFLP